MDLPMMAVARALAELQHDPIVTAKRLGDSLVSVLRRAHQAIAQLEEAHIIRERMGYSRNRTYAANDALTIHRPLGAEPIMPGRSATDGAT